MQPTDPFSTSSVGRTLYIITVCWGVLKRRYMPQCHSVGFFCRTLAAVTHMMASRQIIYLAMAIWILHTSEALQNSKCALYMYLFIYLSVH